MVIAKAVKSFISFYQLQELDFILNDERTQRTRWHLG